MLAVPAATPFTTPKPGPVVAIVTSLLFQAPPAGALVRVVVSPMHTAGLPAMASGGVFTVTVAVVKQRELS